MPFNLESIAPYLGATGQALLDLDEGKDGADDFAGALLVYAAEVIVSILEDSDLPKFPAALNAGTSDKIRGAFRATLIVANSLLTIARFQTHGDAAKALRYVSLAISMLLANKPVPAGLGAMIGLDHPL